jgi:hypothetical protein
MRHICSFIEPDSGSANRSHHPSYVETIIHLPELDACLDPAEGNGRNPDVACYVPIRHSLGNMRVFFDETLIAFLRRECEQVALTRFLAKTVELETFPQGTLPLWVLVA